jgi:hypothetical protein
MKIRSLLELPAEVRPMSILHQFMSTLSTGRDGGRGGVAAVQADVSTAGHPASS